MQREVCRDAMQRWRYRSAERARAQTLARRQVGEWVGCGNGDMAMRLRIISGARGPKFNPKSRWGGVMGSENAIRDIVEKILGDEYVGDEVKRRANEVGDEGDG